MNNRLKERTFLKVEIWPIASNLEAEATSLVKAYWISPAGSDLSLF